MLDEITRAAALQYYARIGAALFPIPYGAKNPTGIIESFKRDHSSNPEQWVKWKAEHNCNFGLVAGPSRLIVADIDVSEIGRDRAWAIWCEWWQSRGLDVPSPHTQSARGGWHTLFSVPFDFDISTLRQIALIGPTSGSKKAIVDLRVGYGFVVAAGSYYDGTAKGEQSGNYVMLSDAAPYPAPIALIEHCRRKPVERATTSLPSSHDRDDVATLLRWLNERDQFTDYESWCQIGMALRIEFGDSGLDLWKLTFDDTVASDVAHSKWQSFSTEPDANSVTILSFMDRAHRLGWHGQVRKSSAAMFDGVAQIAAAAGATLQSGTPIPMMGGDAEFTRFCTPLLADFMASTSKDTPTNPTESDYAYLPDAAASRGLYAPMQDALKRLYAAAEAKKPKFDISRAYGVLGTLQVLHADVFNAVIRRLETMGHKPSLRKIGHVSQNIEEQVERGTTGFDKWIRDTKTNKIENDNPDNIRFGLEYLGLELRWNGWVERMQIKGGTENDCRWNDWANVDDTAVAKLRTRWSRTRTRFCPGKDFTWETLLAVAHENVQDPVLDVIAEMEKGWDGTPRLNGWLARYCRTSDDAYHQAVSKLIIGGMVMRARKPGCKFDFMPVLYGPQGTGKSTLAAILALRMEWFTDNVMLGDASKELILALAGKLVVEIAEMGMRGHANVNHVKAMISRQEDIGRTAYARSVTERKRRNIFIGTTNEDTPLSDPTGNRRFLPVHITQEIDTIALFNDIGQLIGEAAALESKGEQFALPREVWSDAAAYQEGARSESDLEVQFDEWFGGDVQAFVSVTDLITLNTAAGRKSVGVQVHQIMKRLGFRQDRPHISGVRTRVWVRGPQMKPNHVAELPRFVVDITQHGAPRVFLRPVTGAPGGLQPPPPVRSVPAPTEIKSSSGIIDWNAVTPLK